MKRLLKISAKVLGWLLIIIIALVFLVAILIQVPFIKNKVAQRVLVTVNQSLLGNVELGRIEGNLFTHARLLDVVVKNERGDLIARVPKVTAKYGLLGAIRSQLTVKNIEVDNLLAIVQVYEDGSFNFETIAKPSETDSGPGNFEVFLDKIQLNDGLIIYADTSQNTAEQPLDPKRVQSLATFMNALQDKAAIHGDIQALASKLETIISPAKPQADKTSPDTPPTTPPIMAIARQLKLEASFALRSNQMISFDLKNFQTDANLDTLPMTLPIRSQNIAGFYEPAAADIQLKRFDLGHDTSINDLRLIARFHTETDAFGNRSTTTPRQLAADLDSLQIGKKFANIFTPEPLLKTDLNLNLQAGGNLEDLSFITQILPFSGPEQPAPPSNHITIAGHVDLGDPDTNRLPEYKISLAAHQIDPKQLINLDSVLDGNFAANLKNATILIEGQSFDPDSVNIDASIAIEAIKLQIDQPETKQSDTYQVDTLYLSAQYADGLATLQQLGLLTPYINAFASGIFDPTGTFSAELRTTADPKQTTRASSLSPKLMKTRPPAQADLNLDITGLFDPDIQPVQDAIQSAQLTATWNFKDFEAESIQITRSHGNIDAALLRTGTPQAPLYAADFKLNTENRGLRAATSRVATLSARAKGKAALTLPLDQPLQALQNMSFDTQLTTAGLRAGSNQLDAVTLHIGIDQKTSQKTNQSATFNYNLHTTLNDLRAADATIKALAADLQGSLTLANTLGASNARPIGPDAVRHLSARGKFNALDLRAADNHVDKINTTIEIDGSLKNLLGNIQASATDITAASQQFDNINLNLNFAPQRAIQLTATAVPQEDAKRTISASIAGNYHADLAGIDLNGLQLSTRRASWTLQPDGQLSARATALVFEQFTLQNGAQKIQLHGTFRPSGAQSLDVQIANFDLAALRYGFFLDTLPTMAGQINLDASLRGSTRKPELASTFKAKDIVFKRQGPFSAAANLNYRNERLQLSELELTAFGKSVLTGRADLPMIFDLTGKFILPFDRPLDFSLNLADSELADFQPYVDILEQNNVSGAVHGFITMNGTLDKPDLQANFELAHGQFIGTFGNDQIDLRDVSTQTKITYTPPAGNRGGLMIKSNIELSDETIASFELDTPLPLARWIHEEMNATGTGFEITNALLNTPVRLALKMPGFDVQKIPLESLREMDAAGIAKVDITANGTFGNPDANIKIAVDDFGWEHYRNIFLDFDANIANRVLRVKSLRLEWDADELIVASGVVPIPFSELMQGQAIADLPADFTIELRETLVSKLSAIDYDFARIRGSVAGYIQMKGSLRNPEFTARAGLFNTELGDGRLGTIAMSIDGKDNVVNANASICREQEDVLLANARLPILTDLLALSTGASPLIDGELDINIKSDNMEIAQVLPAKLVEEFITEASGVLDIDLQVAGTWKATTASGDIILKNGAATMPSFGRRVEKVQANINISDDQYTIHEISLRDGPSSANINGKIKHRALRPQDLDLHIKTDDFNIGGFATDFPVYVRSKIDAKGTLAGPDAEVDVKITNLNVIVADTQAAGTLPTSLNEDIIIIEGRSRRAAKDPREVMNLTASDENTTGLLDMRVKVDVARDSWIRHPMGDVNLQANIQADIRGGTIILSGQADALRGQVDFLGKRFVVQPSNVLFTGAVPPDPRLSVEATYPLDRAVVDAIGEPTTGEARIIFRVTGTATNPRLELSSDPPMTDSEILFVLVTGRPPDRSDAGQDEGVANKALGAVSGLFLGMLQDKLAGTIPIDVLKIEPGAHGVGRIEVGKYLTPDVFASVRRDFGDEEIDASNIVRIEYHFLSRWMLELVYSDQGDGELNMYWDVY